MSMLFSMVISAQDIRNTVYAYSDPVATYKDGFNIGFGFDYQREHSYNTVSLFLFPDLRGLNYTELTASHGVNIHLGYFNNHRFYGGLKAGGVWRETGKAPYGIIGFNGGYEYHFNNGFFIGGMLGYDFRSDGKIWSAKDSGYWRKNGWIKIGFTL